MLTAAICLKAFAVVALPREVENGCPSLTIRSTPLNPLCSNRIYADAGTENFRKSR
jgi:hypothetical protein